MPPSRRVLSALAVLCCAASLASAQQVWLTYDASENQLPQEQCWSLSANNGAAPAAAGGVLNLGPSSTGGVMYYARQAAISYTRGAVIEGEVFIVNSPYRANPCGAGQRAGTYLAMFDDGGRLAYLGIGNDRVFITSNGDLGAGASAPTAAFACQNAWHTYRMEVAAGVIDLFIDGAHILSAPHGGRVYGVSREAEFGDLSVCADGHARIRNVRVLVVEDCPADFNRDGFVDFFDFGDFVDCFETDTCPCDKSADYNGDEFVDFFDFDAYVEAFERGC